MRKKPQRIVSLLLSLLLFLCALPTARAYEMGDPWQADLTDFLDNENNRAYVEMMLDYYLRNDE